MNETALVATLMKTLRRELPHFVHIKHSDKTRSGVPDISITGHGVTSWWEVKHADPEFHSKGIQELTLLRLSKAGIARYVIFAEGTPHTTRVVHPRLLKDWKVVEFAEGYNFDWIVTQIRFIHKQ